MNVQVLVRNEPHLCQSLRKCRDLLAFEASLCGFQREDCGCQPSPPIHTHTHTHTHPASATRASSSKCCVYVCMRGGIAVPSFYEAVSWDMSVSSIASLHARRIQNANVRRHISHALLLSHSIYECYTNTMSIIPIPIVISRKTI